MTRRTMLKFFFSFLAVGLGSYWFLQQKLFGKTPSGSRLDRILKSPNHRNGVFQNLSPTEVTSNKDASTVDMIRKFVFGTENIKPPKPLPSVKTDLKNLAAETPTIVWLDRKSVV